MSAYKCMVIGGAGFVGTELCFLLGKRFGTDNVIVIDNFGTECGKEILVAYGYKVIKGSSTNRAVMQHLIDDFQPDIVYYLANKNCNRDPSVVNENLLGLGNVSEICATLDIPVLFLSSAKVYGDVSNTIQQKIGCKENHRFKPESNNALSDIVCEFKLVCLSNTSNLKYAIVRACESFSLNQKYSPENYGFVSKSSTVSFSVTEDWGISLSPRSMVEEREWVHVEELCKAIDVIGDFLMYDYGHVSFCGNIFNVSGAEKIKSIDLVRLISKNKGVNYSIDKYSDKFIEESALSLDGSLISTSYGFKSKRKITNELLGVTDE